MGGCADALRCIMSVVIANQSGVSRCIALLDTANQSQKEMLAVRAMNPRSTSPAR